MAKKIIFVICIFELYLLVLSKSADDWALGNIWERKTILDNFAIIMISSSLAYFLTTRPAKLTRFSFFRLFLVTIAATRRKRGVFVPAVVSPSSMKREVFGGFWRFEKNTESRRVQNIDTFKKFQIAFFVSTLSKSKPPYSHLMLTHATFQNI